MKSQGTAKTLPISEYQKRFFIEWSFKPKDTVYNLPFSYKLNGDLNKEALRKSCEVIFNTNDVLRSHFNNTGDICSVGNYDFKQIYKEINLDSDNDIYSQIETLTNKPFDLTKGPLCVFYLLDFKNQSNEYYFIINFHHVILDGVSTSLLLKKISSLYNAIIGKAQEIPLTADDSNLHEAVRYEQQFFNDEHLEEYKSFWLRFIADCPLNIHLPYKPKINPQDLNPRLGDLSAEAIFFELNSVELSALNKYAKKNRTTLFILLAAVYSLIVSKYSNQKNFLISFPINMRPPRQQSLLGCFVNNIPLKVEIDKYETFNDFIKGLTQQRKVVSNYQPYLFSKVIHDQITYNKIDLENYFNVGFGASDFGSSIYFKLDNLDVEDPYIPIFRRSATELQLLYDANNKNKLKFMLIYRTKLLDSALVSAFLGSLETFLSKLIKASIEDSDQAIYLKPYHILNDFDFNKMIYAWNETAANFPQNKTLQQLFEEQANRTPDYTALVFKDFKLSYAELNQRANRLAHFLQKNYSPKGDDLIALCLERNENILIGILAILKSGAAYVPIDPGYPADRIGYILSDTAAKIIITDKATFTLIEKITQNHNFSIAILVIDDRELINKLSFYPESNLNITITSQNLAYVIYTSGTTGKPKGVMIEHKSVINTIFALYPSYDLSPGAHVTALTSYVFDGFVGEIFVALFIGAQIYLLDESTRKDVHSLSHYLFDKKIQLTYLPPIILSHLDRLEYPYLKRIIYGGEPCDKPTGQYWSNAKLLFNYYGPTETSIFAVGKHVINGDVHLIGRPIYNAKIYILDSDLNPLPLGAIGELYIGGAGVARGYLNLPSLTASRFINNPFQTAQERASGTNTRLYKTGDLGRYLPDGNIEYLGRNDFQVKLRGFRIELGEIETILADYPGIKKAVAMLKQHPINKNPYLACYYTADTPLEENNILKYLHEHLPEYMLPSALVWLKTLPITINGKLDSSALPDPNLSDTKIHIAPSNDLELKVCEIYARILNLPSHQVGMQDDFFKLGGNSILAIRLVTQLNEQIFNNPALQINHALSITDIYQFKTIRQLLDFVLSETVNEQTSMLPILKYRTITKLNEAVDKPIMFMVHPSRAGSEVYVNLAQHLTAKYCCYGIDNYNLHHKFKFITLNSLARYYLSTIEEQVELNKNSQIVLLGWSLGGLISLEMACILEKKGYKHIKIYLLDTILNEEAKTIYAQIGYNKLRQQLYNEMITSYDKNYAKNIANNFITELKMSSTRIRAVLMHTKVTLFKAKLLNGDLREEFKNFQQKMIDAKFNNIDKVVSDISQLELIEMDQADHDNILSFVDDLTWHIS